MSNAPTEIGRGVSEARRALFVELLGGIGDLIFTLPALDALSRSQPHLRWDFLTFAPGATLLSADPRVQRVFIARRGQPAAAAGPTPDSQRPFCWHDLAAQLQAQRYELIVTDTRHSGIHELIESSDAPWKITQLWKGTGPTEPIARLFLRRLREEGAIDPDWPDPPARIFLTPAEVGQARRIWNQLGVRRERAVIFNPHAGMAIKRWPSDAFIQLGQALQAEGRTVIVLEGEDRALARAIAKPIGAALLPWLPLRETAACLAGAALLVSGDSGLAHLASAVGTPVLAIFGPTWAGRYGVPPPGRNLQSPFDCPDRQPMDFTLQRCWYTGRCIFAEKQNCCEDVTAARALAAAREILQEHPRSSGRRESEPGPLTETGQADEAIRSLAPDQWRRHA